MIPIVSLVIIGVALVFCVLNWQKALETQERSDYLLALIGSLLVLAAFVLTIHGAILSYHTTGD